MCTSHHPKLCTINQELQKYRDEEQTVTDLMFLLQKDEWRNDLATFVEQESDKSVTFSFWWKYMEMVSLLLMFTRAQRNGLWQLHLTTFKKMIPFFFQYDHQNYARWGFIYAAQMMQVPDEIREEFVRGNFVVKCSKQKF